MNPAAAVKRVLVLFIAVDIHVANTCIFTYPILDGYFRAQLVRNKCLKLRVVQSAKILGKEWAVGSRE